MRGAIIAYALHIPWCPNQTFNAKNEGAINIFISEHDTSP